ncbi:gamma-aminobutyric acid receptor alpha-like isoform X2 [Lineus longissimus]|uniref:gamma-aminobutyric acid receptor alpha-like isoform X2 n=1 Tax=Lineus longissimus TaxID=88925 RepID=UPI002B4C61F4
MKTWIVTHICLVISALIGYCLGQNVTTEEISNITQVLDRLLTGYDKKLRPGFGGPPTEVSVWMSIRSMGPVSEIDMMYSMDCYFRQTWVDSRLSFTGNMEKLQLNVAMLKEIWKPDTYVLNGKGSYLHVITGPNILLRIDKHGRILYSMRLTIKATCPMHLEKFPMDLQSCPLQVGSYGYTQEDIHYQWKNGPADSIEMADGMTLSQFDLMGHPARNGTFLLQDAQYSTLIVHFELQRHMGYFVIQVYLPCSLLVVLSWVAFWINREATADRIALGITTVLTMAFLGIDNRTNLPKVSYSTAIDWYLATCFAFVLATIIQFAGVHYFTKHGSGELHLMLLDDEEEEERKQEARNCHPVSYYNKYSDRDGDPASREKLNGDTNTGIEYEASEWMMNDNCCMKFFNCLRGSAKYRDMKSRTSKRGVNSVSKIDRIARVLFPGSFLFFNICYWTVYLRIL